MAHRARRTNRRHPMGTRARQIAYSVGTVSSPLLYQAIGGYLIYFYTNVVRLEVWLISLAYAVAYGVWNAINDPLVGQLSDRTRTRWGRRIPFVFVGAPLAAVLFVMVWSPPVGGQALADSRNLGIFAWLFVTIGLFDLAFSTANTSYAALFPEMYRDIEERSLVSIYRQIGAVVGLLLALGGTLPLVAMLSPRAGTFGGWSLAAGAFALVAWAGFWVSIAGSRERPEYREEGSLPFWPALRATFSNRAFLAAAVAMLAVNVIWGWLSTMGAFFNRYALGAAESQTGILFLAMFGASVACYPPWRWITLRVGSKKALTWSVAVFAVLTLGSLFAASFLQGIIMFAALGAANAGITLVREIVLSDVIDADELTTGVRREGMYFGVINFVERLSLVVISGATALVLGVGRYAAGAASQSPRAVLALRIGIPGLALAALLVFLVAMRFYPLGAEQVRAMRRQLEQRHAAADAPDGDSA
jgi:glycoside/pentoside/hexuronide:cation symporter, GPH family